MSRHELPDGPIRPLKKRRVRCDACHQLFPAGSLYHGADPFAEEILGDSTPVRQCANCTAESAMDI